MLRIEIDDRLVEAVVRATSAGLQMANAAHRPVGCSVLATRPQETAVVVGLVGRRPGTVSLGLSTRAALFLASRFLDAECREVDEQVFDAVAEIANIVAGRLKGELGEEEFGVSHISCPAVIVGADYHVHHFRGFSTVSVEFELEGMPPILANDRIFSTTLSLSRG